MLDRTLTTPNAKNNFAANQS